MWFFFNVLNLSSVWYCWLMLVVPHILKRFNCVVVHQWNMWPNSNTYRQMWGRVGAAQEISPCGTICLVWKLTSQHVCVPSCGSLIVVVMSDKKKKVIMWWCVSAFSHRQSFQSLSPTLIFHFKSAHIYKVKLCGILYYFSAEDDNTIPATLYTQYGIHFSSALTDLRRPTS